MTGTPSNRRRWLVSAVSAGASFTALAATNGVEAAFSGAITKPIMLRYLIWVPEAVDRPAAGWPLMIFLHGSGERGGSLAKVTANGPPEQAVSGRKFPFVLVAPQAERGDSWDSDAIEALRAHLVAHLPIDADRVMVTGLSMGGYGAWNYAASYPDRVAAIAPISGIGDAERARRVARVPVWAFHGALDDVVPLAGDLEMVRKVRRFGGTVKSSSRGRIGR
jgi:predicted peptidase